MTYGVDTEHTFYRRESALERKGRPHKCLLCGAALLLKTDSVVIYRRRGAGDKYSFWRFCTKCGRCTHFRLLARGRRLL